jgi:hypothetical protein
MFMKDIEKQLREEIDLSEKQVTERKLKKNLPAIMLLHKVYREIDNWLDQYQFPDVWKKISYKVGVAFGYIYGYACIQRKGVIHTQKEKFVYYEIPEKEDDADDC